MADPVGTRISKPSCFEPAPENIIFIFINVNEMSKINCNTCISSENCIFYSRKDIKRGYIIVAVGTVPVQFKQIARLSLTRSWSRTKVTAPATKPWLDP